MNLQLPFQTISEIRDIESLVLKVFNDREISGTDLRRSSEVRLRLVYRKQLSSVSDCIYTPET